MIQVLAIVAISFVVYVYLLFPAVVYLRGWLLQHPWIIGDALPKLDVVIVCHNEVAHIKQKLDNVLSQEYPQELLHVIVASDGSDDGTDEVVRNIDSDAVKLLSFPRRGKIPALNDAVATARGEVLVFSDANSQFDSDALRKLVRHFSDARVGCVAGNQVYTRTSSRNTAVAGEYSYWNFDRLLKIMQSKAGNAISATGAIYAIRRKLFQEVPSGVTDDFTISTRAILQGFRLVFDAEAIAREPVAVKPQVEFRRKVRVMTRGFRAVWMVRDLLNPFRFGFYSLQLLSHKVLRRLVVFPLMFLLILTPWMWNAGGWLGALAIVQWVFYALALIGFVCRNSSVGTRRLFSIPQYFCLVNIAAIVAATNFLTGRRIERWESQREDSQHDFSATSAEVLQ